MKRAALLFAGFALAAAATSAGEGDVRRSAKRVPGRYVAVLAPGGDAARFAATVRSFDGARIRHQYQHGLKGFALDVSDADAQMLASDPNVHFMEEDSVISIASTTWALDRIDQRQLPLDGRYESGSSGAGVTVYVVDTGIFAGHGEFGGRVAAGFNAVSDNGGTADCNGHGTHVAALAAGTTFGVAPAATLVPVRVLDCNGAGTVSTLLAGLDWIAEKHAASPHPAVVNMSLGGGVSSSVDTAVSELIAAGVTTVVAAGNGSGDACGISPARVRGAITVGATTESDQRAWFSNYGECVDLFAPGLNVLSGWHTGPNATGTSSGTSAAAPLVAGVAALCLEKYPDASPAAVAQTIAAQATHDVVADAGAGSPNRLLFAVIDSLDGAAADEQLFSDPGFESGTTFWSSDVCSASNPAGCTGDTDSSYGDYGYPSRSGSSHAAIGGAAKSFQVMSETITMPSRISRAELSVYLWVVTKNKSAAVEDTLTVEVRDGSGALVEVLGTFSNLDAGPGYIQRRFDVSRHSGATIRIAFTGSQSKGPPTWFLLDDAALKVWD